MLDKRRPVHFPRSLTMLVMVKAVKQRHIPNPRPRGYSRTFLRTIKAEVKDSFRQGNRPARGNKKMGNIIPFVSIFSPTSLTLNSAVKTNFKALQGVVEPMANFKIIAAFKRNKNLKDYLV